MSLNVRDPEGHQLAQAIYRAMGENFARIVTEALRAGYREIQQRRSRASAVELLAIADRAVAQLKRPDAHHAELVYDVIGQPK